MEAFPNLSLFSLHHIENAVLPMFANFLEAEAQSAFTAQIEQCERGHCLNSLNRFARQLLVPRELAAIRTKREKPPLNPTSDEMEWNTDTHTYLGPIHLNSPNFSGADLTLWLENGYIVYLVGVSHNEPWPDPTLLEDFTLSLPHA